jgi:fructose-1,6-bisphosphatase
LQPDMFCTELQQYWFIQPEKEVNGFTLDPSIGEFCLSHRDIKIPEDGAFYSVNQGYYLKFDLEMRRYIDYCSDNTWD